MSPHVATLLAGVADALETSAPTPASYSTASTFAPSSLIVDVLGTTPTATILIMIFKALEEKRVLSGWDVGVVSKIVIESASLALVFGLIIATSLSVVDLVTAFPSVSFLSFILGIGDIG